MGLGKGGQSTFSTSPLYVLHQGPQSGPAATSKRAIPLQRMTHFLSASIIMPGQDPRMCRRGPDRLRGEDVVVHRRGIALHFLEPILDYVADRDDADQPALIDHG